MAKMVTHGKIVDPLYILYENILFCTAAGAVAEIQTVCFVNIEFRERKKLILNQDKRASHFVKIIVACPHHLPLTVL
jgi:hypothetical protein